MPNAEVLARFTLAVQHPLSRTWLSDDLRMALLTEERSFDVRLSTDLDFALQRAQLLGIDRPAEDLLNRWVTVSAGLDALLSIRFEGGDVQLPFVDISVTSRPVVAGDLEALEAAASHTFPGFGCSRLRFWDPGPVNSVAGTAPDLRVLTAPLTELRAREVPRGLTLSPTPDHRHLADAAEAYAAVDQTHPDHVHQARVIDAEALSEAIAAGTMFDVWWQDAWSGYAGTLPESQLGLPAQVIQELLLIPAARGRGLGRHLSTLLAQVLPDDGRVLSGTIHGGNTGAIRAAHAAGRHDIGGWSWWPYRTALDS